MIHVLTICILSMWAGIAIANNEPWHVPFWLIFVAQGIGLLLIHDIRKSTVRASQSTD